MVFKKAVMLAVLGAGFLYAQNNQMADFKTLIQNITIEADNSHENIFYKPYIISVYKGEELEKLGLSRLYEALELIPGLDIYSDNLDMKTAIFRGSNPLAYGQTKLFIDGVLVNDVFIDQYSNYLDMPIELIKRIEIIRGPGGKSDRYAIYAGAIYVYTNFENQKRCNCFKAFAKAGSDSLVSSGFYKNFFFENGLKLYIEGYVQSDNRYEKSGYDALASGAYGDINAHLSQSGRAPLWVKDYSAALNMEYKGFTLKSRYLYYKHGAAYGLSYILPDDDDYYMLPSKYLEVGKKFNVKGMDIELLAGVKYDSFKYEGHIAPKGLVYPDILNPGSFIIFNYGLYGIYESKQRSRYASAEFHKVFDKNCIKFGYIYTKDETYDVKTYTTDRTGNSAALVDYSDTLPFFKNGVSREINRFYFSDEYPINNKLTLYFGASYENSTHEDGVFDPKISLVYQLNSENIFKLLASRSHRNPSWQELFTINNTTRVGNKDLEPEKVSAYEINYIKKFSVDDYIQLTLFYLKNQNVITNINPERKFYNSTSQKNYGFEVELKKSISSSLQFYGNYSYISGECGCDEKIANISNHLVKAYLLHQITPNLDGSIIYYYIGKKNRFYFDNREPMPGYDRVDIAFNYKFNNSFTAQLAVKNLFESDIKQPSIPNSYLDDYPQLSDRKYLFGLRWRY